MSISTQFERKPGQTLWLQVADALKHEIDTGLHSAGAQLPTEPELMRRFGVSRFTVRQAMAHLQSTGAVRVEQGRGTFVASSAVVYDISRRTRFSRNLSEQGIEPGNENLLHEIIPAPAFVAEALNLPLGAPVVRRLGIGTADGIPLEMAENYYPAGRFPDMREVRERSISVSEMLRFYGIEDYSRAWTTIGARIASIEEAAQLKVSPGATVLVTSKLDVDTNGIPINFGITIWSADLVTFRLSNPADDGATRQTP